MAHIGRSYLPRVRPAAPRQEDAPAKLLASWRDGAVVWVPYPHQNLGALRRAQGATEALAAGTRLAGLPSFSLPAFGPFGAPPARELAVATDATGRRLSAVARVYPLIAALARLGGKLAGNPWLAGGDVELSGARRATVSWQGTLWRLDTEPSLISSQRAGGAEAAQVEVRPVLAWLRISAPPPPFPAGLYRLERSGTSIQLTNGQFSGPPAEPPATGAALQVVTAGAALGSRGPGAFFLWPTQAANLAAVAIVRPASGESWDLPGEEILSLTGTDPRSVTEGEWTAEALDRASLERAAAALPALRQLFAADARGALALGVWLDPAAAAGEVRRVERLLSAVPLVGRAERQRWRDLRRLLEALAGFRQATLLVQQEPGAARLRLER